MSQLPTILPTQGLKTPVKTSATPGFDEAVDSGEQMEESTFADAVQEALEATQDNPFAGFGVALNLPLQPTAPPQCRGGNPLPLAAIANGTQLPPYAQLSSAPQTELIGSLGLKDLKLGPAMQNIGTGTGQTAPLFNALPSAQAVLAASKTPGDEDLSAQFGLSGVHAAHSTAAGRAVQFVPPLEIPVGQPGWDKAVGERIQWMIGQHIQSAEVKLTPPHLGPLEIRISVQQDQASVSFMAAHLPTREALEAAIPRLREMFGEANLNLVDVGVGQGGGSDAQSQHQSEAGGNARIANATAGLMPSDPGIDRPGLMLGTALVDDYA